MVGLHENWSSKGSLSSSQSLNLIGLSLPSPHYHRILELKEGTEASNSNPLLNAQMQIKVS